MFETIQNSASEKIENYTSNQSADNRNTKNIAEKFIGALTELESAGDVELMVTLFAENCEVGNIVNAEKFRGIAEARRFWTHYRSCFKDLCSIFQTEFYSGNEAQIQWKTIGKSRDGRKIKYEGVSVFETNDGKITRFYASFDKDHLQKQIKGVRRSGFSAK